MLIVETGHHRTLLNNWLLCRFVQVFPTPALYYIYPSPYLKKTVAFTLQSGGKGKNELWKK